MAVNGGQVARLGGDDQFVALGYVDCHVLCSFVELYPPELRRCPL